MIEVLDPGLLSSLQDLGRPGWAHLGIGRSGAADAPALRLAQALVGNPADACGIECTLRGPKLRIEAGAHVALTGAPTPQARLNGEPFSAWTSVWCPAGSELDIGPMAAGCRSYLAIEGGIDGPPWLGSRSVDLNAGLGPLDGRALRRGDRLPLGPRRLPERATSNWSLDPRPWFIDVASHTPMRLLESRHTAVLSEASRDALTQSTFQVTADSNRVGIRLQGEQALQLRDATECISEGVVAGVMQLPPGGKPILLATEHPVTGGYPRIAQLAAADLPRLGQCRPGDALRFEWVDLQQARHLLAAQRRSLDDLCRNIARRLEQGT
ncbi:biotin-dependent carboxyltransferase family protein [Oleiagrimonas citrea]|uniref:Biotin-dependent carboxyltransferase family protein n=1 Tax=Oleiagrimonas citrea TaxID=1665687 RepID=A0A846ZS43_9GAMM|nr:biotin-dependent carboxyltransferase family protein [Oleiagrimonas citrea]NKZ40201.1 biotin-dependent carboxyltransferase family protein [Oleiagrimonas citrea]